MTDSNPLRLIPDAELNPVPVFNCIVILSKPESDGSRTGRVANLQGQISVSGNGEREILTAIVKKFKAIAVECTQQNKEIPWLDPPETPAKGESQRFVPVHL